MKYLLAIVGLLLVAPLSVSASTCNDADIAAAKSTLKLSEINIQIDDLKKQLARYGTYDYSQESKRLRAQIKSVTNEYNTRLTQVDSLCFTFASQRELEEQKRQKKEEAKRLLEAEAAARQAEIDRTNAALYANQPTEPSKPVPTPKPAVNPKVVVPSDVTVGHFKPDDISGETGVFIGTSSTPTSTIQEQVEVQEPVAVETVPTPEVKEGFVFKVLRSISNFFKKLW